MRSLCLLAISAFLFASCAKGETDPRDDGDGSPIGLGDDDETSGEGAGNNQNGEECAEGQQRCGSGECIADKYFCDVKAHCVDASDEFPNNPACTEPMCEVGQFMCTSGDCITGSYQCDGYPDCADESDEATAVCGTMTCTASQWQCLSGECIPLDYYCDTITDCSDGSDESAC
jgi:hypothetical protein